MTAVEFKSELSRLNLTQAAFARMVEHLSGQRLGNQSVNRWAQGRRAVPPLAVAVLRLFEELPASKRRLLPIAD